ncbi:hypothetical protein V2J09_005422 [Rumex salicifolius]
MVRAVKTAVPRWNIGWPVAQLRANINRLLAILFHQGVLDENFIHLQSLEDEAAPNFVVEVVQIYFQETEKLSRILRGLLMGNDEIEFEKVEVYVNQLIGSSSSIGANRIRHVCVAFRSAAQHSNRHLCLRALGVLEEEYCYLKNKLHEFFQMEQERQLAAGARYPVNQQ